jgi:hypothetical protein
MQAMVREIAEPLPPPPPPGPAPVTLRSSEPVDPPSAFDPRPSAPGTAAPRGSATASAGERSRLPPREPVFLTRAEIAARNGTAEPAAGGHGHGGIHGRHIEVRRRIFGRVMVNGVMNFLMVLWGTVLKASAPVDDSAAAAGPPPTPILAAAQRNSVRLARDKLQEDRAAELAAAKKRRLTGEPLAPSGYAASAGRMAARPAYHPSELKPNEPSSILSRPVRLRERLGNRVLAALKRSVGES